jgi:hypothetical protein
MARANEGDMVYINVWDYPANRRISMPCTYTGYGRCDSPDTRHPQWTINDFDKIIRRPKAG